MRGIYKMKVMIRETSSIEELVCINPFNSFNAAKAIIDLGLDDGEFVYDIVEELHHCSRATFEYWSEVLTGMQGIYDRAFALSEKHGEDEIEAILGLISDECDFSLFVAMANAALDHVFGSSEDG